MNSHAVSNGHEAGGELVVIHYWPALLAQPVRLLGEMFRTSEGGLFCLDGVDERDPMFVAVLDGDLVEVVGSAQDLADEHPVEWLEAMDLREPMDSLTLVARMVELLVQGESPDVVRDKVVEAGRVLRELDHVDVALNS